MTPQEFVSKLILFSNPQTREATEAASKAKTMNDVSWLFDHYNVCRNTYFGLSVGIIPCSSIEEKNQLLSQCNQEILLCEQKLRQVAADAFMDHVMSQYTKNMCR